MVDYEKIKKAVIMIIEAIGEDPSREGLKETPDRIARMYSEIFSGLKETPEKHLSKVFEVNNDDVVIEKDIQFYSMCEHHFLPFFGKVHIAYIPNKQVVGLSKLARTMEVFSKRPQLQERLTSQIADSLMKYLNCKGVMVVIEAEHLCMSMRGVKKWGAKTTTVVTRGIFQDDNSLKQNVLNILRF
ncbi:GTP cyclohydrolase I FolE [Clostridium botulinum]|uniref:GTP cyclohydrolase I FolE n=1 Tax=Clostridium botulinum TaxID=1491 RepID=UPI00052D3CC7|nr:GTP cyclohydrolase I FolE [Clostridium botulinum]KGM93264.1 GTP cyclohydrolase [Clostridium botulinum D str. CCUG 7971]KOC49363.1 GTP cyclohydrolase [Clostridium botulinum]MCD3350957.1 GTP cyclohydrolase I FolE [Clostridium botulinum D/C]MCD3359913.1 GTP cyclohydrolase I FolE [Clostridium botulinum D/C]MCD3361634.1 GTP cyclohydrolase I FolE [Clostridium botulinum D/C]